MSLILFGPPGSGKGTQCQELCEKLNLQHVSTGDVFRRMIKDKSPQNSRLAEQLNQLLSQGQLVPDEMTIEVLKSEMDRFPGKQFLFDGFPRTQPQADQLLKLLEMRGDKVDMAVFMNVANEQLVQRLSGRRSCPQCQSVYNVFSSPPKKEGVCDKCGSELVQRSDDKESVVGERLKVYESNTRPLVDFFKKIGLYREVNALGSVKEVTDRIIQVIK